MTTVDLKQLAAQYTEKREKAAKRIVICAGTGCVANGALKVRDALVEEINKLGLNAIITLEDCLDSQADAYISKSGCQGFCQMGPLLRFEEDNILYNLVKPADAAEIAEKTIKDGEVIDRLLYKIPGTTQTCRGEHDIPFYERQTRVVMANATIDPEDIEEYIAKGGYEGARKAITSMSAEEVCQELIDSGLRGRGGGGFPTGLKWKFTLASQNDKKYVICNGDEGDPGAFMDRSLMEGNPHSVIEGMMIAAKGIGADEGYIYVRAEYPLAVERLNTALVRATEAGILGDNLFGTDFSFKLHVMEGAGAFVCGEETALIASIEGKRGEPRPKPPFPAQKGLWDKPTVINNVETLSSIGAIIRDGAAEYRSVGTEKSPGTKTFALTGHVANTGLIEVPFGTTLREIVENIGGGITNNKGELGKSQFKSVQIGGPSGGCLTPAMLDMPLDFDSLKEVGAMVGSGGLVVMNDSTCMVNIAKFFLEFTMEESCGKCTPCRIGNKRLLEMLTDITEGRGTMQHLTKLKALARTIKETSLCGLGQTSPNPVLSTLEHFEDEYIAHVKDHKCPAGQCTSLISYVINDKCIGCTLCARKCPAECITGGRKEQHNIVQDDCVKCGACYDACKFNAIDIK